MDFGVIENGMLLLDTAANYSGGISEKIVGSWLASRQIGSEKLTISTKIYPPYNAKTVPANAAACAARLGVRTIDLLYLHKWDESAMTAETLLALDHLIREGRVRSIGVSNFSATQLAEALELQSTLKLTPFRFLQVINNFAVRGFDEALRQICAANNITVTTYSPLGAGFLTGKHRGGVQPGSRFAVMPAHQAVYGNRDAKRRLTQLEQMSVLTGEDMTHLALKWAFSQPGVASVLIGARNTAHLSQALAALRPPRPFPSGSEDA